MDYNNKINRFIVENRIIRRLLVFAITFIFLKVTLMIFQGQICLQPEVNIAYSIFAGLEILILKFYLQGKKDDADND